jgi:hypothetical protein
MAARVTRRPPETYSQVMARAVLALAVLILLAGCENSPHPVPPESGSGPIAGVIPWTPLTPNLTPPSTAQGPVPIPPGTPSCQATDLTGVVIGQNGAGGHIFVSFRLAGVNGGPCYLDGTPAIGLLDSSGHAIAFRQLPPFGASTAQPSPALVEPGPAPAPGLGLKVGQADLTIDWVIQPETCPPGTPPVIPAKAQIAIPAGGILTIAIPSEPAAYLCSGLGVGGFEGPYVPIQPSPPPPLPAISMSVPSTGQVGLALPYLVTLTNDHPQALDLIAFCPTYEEELFADLTKGSPPLGGKHLYALNCEIAKSIPAGQAVTFQIVFLVPVDAAPGKYTLSFGLGYWNAIASYSQATVTLK